MQNKITLNDIQIHNRIRNFTKNGKGACFESNRALGKIFGIHYITVSKSIKKLEKLEHITISGKTNNRNLISTKKAINIEVSTVSKKANNEKELLVKKLIGDITISQNTNKLLVKLLTTISNNTNQSNNTLIIKEVIERISKKKKTTKKEIEEKNAPYEHIANKFLELVKDFRKNNIINKNKWCNSFRLLEKDVGEDRMTDALAWYSVKIGKPYVPECYSAVSFREKFIKIESAKRRAL